MTASASQAQIDAATAYEAQFVPALFRPWASIVADLAHITAGDRVLDIACGTGVLAREAAARTGQQSLVAGLDPHAGMLAVARDLSPAIDWREGTAEALPFPDRSFDVVVSQFGLMFFMDRDKAIHEMLRVMVPGGRCAVAVWDAIENIAPFARLVALLDRISGKAAGDALRAPFVLGNRRALAALFSGAGATSVDVTTPPGPGPVPEHARAGRGGAPRLAACDGGCAAGARDRPHPCRSGERSRPLRRSRWRTRVQYASASRQREEGLAVPTSRSVPESLLANAAIAASRVQKKQSALTLTRG